MWPVFKRGSEIRLSDQALTGPNGRVFTLRARVNIGVEELRPEPVRTS
jgi:hypothetical protein